MLVVAALARRPERHVSPVGTDRRLGAGAGAAEGFGGGADAVAHEHVRRAVRVAGNEVRGVRSERDVTSVGADRGLEAECVGLCSGGRDADALRRRAHTVADEDVADAVRVAGDEVVRSGAESDVASAGADRRGTAAVARSGLRARAADVDALRDAEGAVADKYVILTVGVAGHEVRGGARKRNVAPVRADRRTEAAEVGFGLRARRGDADAFGQVALAVVHENVGSLVGVTRYEIGRIRLESDIAPVGADRRSGESLAVGFGAAAGNADALDGPRRAIAHEDVLEAVRVTGDEVRRERVERDVASVRTERWLAPAIAVGLRAGAADAHALRRRRERRVGARVEHAQGGSDDQQSCAEPFAGPPGPFS